ncbi:hypothetical protein AAZV13_14G070000 [Glycine max]
MRCSFFYRPSYVTHPRRVGHQDSVLFISLTIFLVLSSMSSSRPSSCSPTGSANCFCVVLIGPNPYQPCLKLGPSTTLVILSLSFRILRDVAHFVPPYACDFLWPFHLQHVILTF